VLVTKNSKLQVSGENAKMRISKILNLAYTSWVRREVVSSVNWEVTPPRNENSGVVSVTEDHIVT